MQHMQVAPKVVMIGLRGIPDIEGGIEKHVEALVEQYTKLGWHPVVMGRRDYLKKSEIHRWNGTRIIPVWAPKSVWLEALVHSLLSLWHARKERPDIIHIHAIGPALITPLARLMGYRTVVTHHGFDYERQKWGFFGRLVLRVGEWCGMHMSHARIAVSPQIKERLQEMYKREVNYLPNGVAQLQLQRNEQLLQKYGLEKQKYILLVARLVPEKRHEDLIKAFKQLELSDYKLVLVGGAGWPKKYEKHLEKMAAEHHDIVMTGQLYGEELWAIYSQAALFVLPSSHEGMPLAALEALQLQVPVLLSDIDANLAFELPADRYFKMGDIQSLAEGITRTLSAEYDHETFKRKAGDVSEQYSWSKIAEQTINIYSDLLK